MFSSVLVVFLASILASRIQSSGGRVVVREITLPTQNGQWVAADLFKPESATSEDPAPLVVVVPGFQRSRETLSSISLELSRRGVVVIAIDPYAQGDSSSSMSRRAATTEGYGMFAVVDYAHDTANLNYVDRSRIGATGHSAGGNAAIRGASHFGLEAERTGKPSKLHSVFVSGYVLTLTDKVLQHVFPQRMNNAVMMWAVLNGLVGFLLFFLAYRFHGKKHGIHSGLWGVKTSARELVRTLVLAATLFCAFFGLLFLVYYLFHVDYRFVFLGVRAFPPALLPLLLMYVPLIFVFFLANSLRVNGGMRFQGGSEWRSMLLAGIANTFGLLLIVVVQYSVFAATGTVYWTDGWLYVNLLFAVVPIMFILPYFNRYFFRLTGRIYLGPMTTCLIFVMILLSNTVCYIPL